MATKQMDTTLLQTIFLHDAEGNRAKVLSVRGAEEGLDHLELCTQTHEQAEQGVKMRHRIYTTEV